MTLANFIFRGLGWVYWLGGRNRCDNCGGPLQSGHNRTVTFTEDDIETTAASMTVRLTLCDVCVRAWIIQSESDTERAKRQRAKALGEIQ